MGNNVLSLFVIALIGRGDLGFKKKSDKRFKENIGILK